MRTLILGASGSIGHGVAAELKSHGHEIIALCRSKPTDRALRHLGYDTIQGDLRAPEGWAPLAAEVDAIIHVAATFTADMGDVDRAVVQALCNAVKGRASRPRLIYTGGCWLYGATGNSVASEAMPFKPIAPFLWMVENARCIVEVDVFSLAIIHPANVYHHQGGVFRRFLESARNGDPIELWGMTDLRWPLVHRDDLAVAYRLLVEQPSLVGHFNVSAEDGVFVHEIARAIDAEFGTGRGIVSRAEDDVIRTYGDWAEGAMLDQQMSSRKLRDTTGWTAGTNDFRRSDIFG